MAWLLCELRFANEISILKLLTGWETFVVTEFALTPLIATLLFVLACLSGHQYRRVWKTEGPRWQLWVYGILAAVNLLVLGLIPLDVTG